MDQQSMPVDELCLLREIMGDIVHFNW